MKIPFEINGYARKIIFIIAVVLCITPYIDPPIALLMGLVLSLMFGHPYKKYNSKATNYLLKISVVGLGFGMNITTAISAGREGFAFTITTISFTILLGWLLGKWFGVDKKTSYLISTGTAICGGSAIAAVSPIIKADEKQMSIALGTVFILNSIALLVFPYIGHLLSMTQHQFGIWCAIAIHDTSSVVGASSKYGQEALQTATTVKLERALWIIPLSLVTVFFVKGKSNKIKIPYFIGFYILAMVISTNFPGFKVQYELLVLAAKKGLTLTLFLIGAGLSVESIKSVGIKPMITGVILWIFIGGLSLVTIFFIS